MSNPERKLRCRTAVRSWILLISALTIGAAVAAAQPSTPSSSPASPPSDGVALRTALERNYELLPLGDRLQLRPRGERSGVQSIVIGDDTVEVNGAEVSESVLRAWLNADADSLLRLAAMSDGERRAVFGLSASPEAQGGRDDQGAESALPKPPVAPDAPAAPVPPDAVDEASKVRLGTLVRFAGSATVEEDEIAEVVVAIGGPVRVDGIVEDQATSIGGSMTINGRVSGDVVAVGGSVHLGPKAVVGGDVVSVGGSVDREPGARVEGTINEAAGLGPRIHIGGDRRFPFERFWRGPFASAMELIWSILWIAIFGLIVALTVVVAPQPLERVEAKLAAEPWVAGLTGLLSLILVVPLFLAITVVLLISIIGIPLVILLPFAALFLVACAVLGFTAVALRVGRLIERRFDRRFGSAVATALVGLVAIEGCRLVGQIFALGPGPFGTFGWIFGLTGFLVLFAAWTFGFGAVVLTRFGLGPRRLRNAGPPIEAGPGLGDGGMVPPSSQVDAIAPSVHQEADDEGAPPPSDETSDREERT